MTKLERAKFRVKIRSLMEEARIIRHEERKSGPWTRPQHPAPAPSWHLAERIAIHAARLRICPRRCVWCHRVVGSPA